MATPVAQANGTTSVAIGSALNVPVGGSDTVDITIVTDDPQGRGSATITLTVDTAVVTVTGVAAGDLGTVFYNTVGGVTTMTAATGSSPGPTGTVTFATVTLHAVGSAGEGSDLDIAVTSLYDGTAGDPQPISPSPVTDGTFSIAQSTPTPTPTPTPTETPSPDYIKIEAEDYDQGGEGVAYHDTTSGNSGGEYRSDDVDIEICTEGGYNVGWIAEDEWLKFSDVYGNGGSYSVKLQVASSSSGGTFHIELNGADVTGKVSFGATGGWQTWTVIDAGAISIPSGANTIKLVMDTSGWNVDWIEFSSVTHDDAIDFDNYTISSYAGQDVDPNAYELLDNGYIIHFWGNTWKRITINYNVTENTVIDFYYKSDETEPEIGGIALDNDDSLSSDQSWKVYGTQSWGILDYDNYSFSGNGWTHYVIPVGQTLTGSYAYLGLINDFDGGSGSNSYIKDVRIYEDPRIVDNDDGSPDYTETGSWSTSGSSGYNGGTYRWANAGQSNTATWDLGVKVSGSWKVSVIYRAGSNRCTSSKYVVETAEGQKTVYVDQTQNDLAWVTLGTWDFDANSGSVTLDGAGSSGGSVIISDAVKAEKQ